MGDKNKGYISVSNKFIRDENLTLYEKMLYCIFYSYKGLDEIYLSYETLSRQSGMKRTKLIETIKSLESKKYIKVVKNNYRKTNSYQLLKKFNVRHTNPDVRDTDGDVRQTDVIGSPDGRVPVRHTNPNNKYINNKTLIKEKEIKKKKKVAKSNGLPDWLDKPMWSLWLKHNRKKRKTLPETTIEAQLKKLGKYKKDHVQMIQNAIEANWQSFWPLKDQGTRNNRGNQKLSNNLQPKEGKYDDYA